jgi:hypothetical protein
MPVALPAVKDAGGVNDCCAVGLKRLNPYGRPP